MTESLFPEIAEPDPAPMLSQGQWRRVRQALLVERGLHPLALVAGNLRLHPRADSGGGSRSDLGGVRCGSCTHRYLRHDTAKSYPKCRLFQSRGAATDVLARWPGCVHWTPREEVTH